jgi:small subunit ribosomal protein S1
MSDQTALKTDAPTKDFQTMQELLAEGGMDIKVPKVGDVLEGRVLSVGKNEVSIDIPGYGLGVVRGRELYDESVRLGMLKVGDNVFASVVDPENKDCNIEMSFRQAGQERVWQTLIDKMKAKEVVQTKILEANKGGLMVEINGVIGFLPVSQLSTEHYPRVEEGDKSKILEALKSYVGQMFSVMIITADSQDEKLIVSEKAVNEGELKTKISRLAIGQVVDGEITGIVDFGIFMRFGDGLEGLVHISELSWSRIEHPKDLFRVGQRVKAQIITIENDRVSLSLKRLEEDPWAEAIRKYKVGQVVKGKVTKVMPFGAFVELEPNIYGLVHSVELSSEEIKDPAEIVTSGTEMEFKIISIDPQEHRLGLSLRALTEVKSEANEAKVKEEVNSEPVEPKEEKAE